MTRPVPGPASRWSGYNRSPPSRLWRGPASSRAGRLAVAVGLVLAVAACSVGKPLGSLGGRDSADVTGSIGPAKSAGAASGLSPAVEAALPIASDLAVARAAATIALERGSDATAPWENPETGASGTVTPIASAYTQGGAECRDFLASYVHDKAESWLQGEACRNALGRWEVRGFKPWKRG